MNYSNKDYIEHLRRKYPPGTRLQLSCMEDDFPVPPGSMGTVECIDDAGQIHVDWDCGRSLALIPGVDSFSRLPVPKEKDGDARCMKNAMSTILLSVSESADVPLPQIL